MPPSSLPGVRLERRVDQQPRLRDVLGRKGSFFLKMGKDENGACSLDGTAATITPAHIMGRARQRATTSAIRRTLGH